MNELFVSLVTFRSNFSYLQSIKESQDFQNFKWYQKLKIHFQIRNLNKQLEHLQKNLLKVITHADLTYDFLKDFVDFIKNFDGVSFKSTDAEISCYIYRALTDQYTTTYHIILGRFEPRIHFSISDNSDTQILRYPLKEYESTAKGETADDIMTIFQFKKLIANMMCEYLSGGGL